MRTLLPLVLLPLGLLSGAAIPPAEAAVKNVTGDAWVDPMECAAGDTVELTAEMCNLGSGYVGGTAFLGTYLPRGMPYRVVAPPTRGVCRAVNSGSYTYVFCTVSLAPGACDTATFAVTPAAPGTYSFYISADSANVLRETNELDNRGLAVLTVY